MLNGKVTVKCKQGIQVEMAEALSKIAINHTCSSYLKVRTYYVNAKSILGILSAQVRPEEEIEFVCDGIDEIDCIEKLVDYVEKAI